MRPNQAYSAPTEPFPREEYRARLARLERRLGKAKMDAFFVMGESNRYYLTGFDSSAGVLLTEPGETPVLFTDFRYLEMARTQMDFVASRKVGKWADQLGPLARRRGWLRVGYEGSLAASRLKELQEAMPTVKEWVDAEHHLRELRAVKSPREQKVMRQAAAANDAVFEKALAEVRFGMSEWDIRRLIRSWVDRLGQEEAFDVIACVGANASKCHHHPSRRILRNNRELLLDHGTRVQKYCSDMTRTVFFGNPPRKIREIHKIVLDANRKAVAAVRAGKSCVGIDAVARRHIAKAGYGKYFGHGLGHAVGLDIHEFPVFSASSKADLKAGMIMTIEPGIYVPGVGGVRIEDMVIVGEKGCQVITSSPRTVWLQ